MEVIGQQSRGTLNLFFPTDQQLFTETPQKASHLDASKHTNKPINNKLLVKYQRKYRNQKYIHESIQ